MQSWISDKVIVLSIEDIGKNLASSEALLRHHMILVRDLAVIEERVQQLDSESSVLMNKYSKYTDVILQSQANLISCWEGLRRNANKRGLVLSESQKMHKFLGDYSDIITWISGMNQLIDCDSTPTTLSDGNALFDRFLEYEGEFIAREESFLSTIAFGNSLIASKHSQLTLVSYVIILLITFNYLFRFVCVFTSIVCIFIFYSAVNGVCILYILLIPYHILFGLIFLPICIF